MRGILVHEVIGKTSRFFQGSLNEAQAQWFVAREAMELGHGGMAAMQRSTGLSKPTILRGLRELRERKHLNVSGRVRVSGGGRKSIEMHDPGFRASLQGILEESTGPTSPRRGLPRN